jgi:hypothetical protein
MGMSNLIALDHRADPKQGRVDVQEARQGVLWSPRQRLFAMAGCIIAAWLLVLVPFIIWG